MIDSVAIDRIGARIGLARCHDDGRMRRSLFSLLFSLGMDLDPCRCFFPAKPIFFSPADPPPPPRPFRLGIESLSDEAGEGRERKKLCSFPGQIRFFGLGTLNPDPDPFGADHGALPRACLVEGGRQEEKSVDLRVARRNQTSSLQKGSSC